MMTKRTKLWLPFVVILMGFLGALVIVVSKPDVKTEQPVVSPKAVKVMKAVPQSVQIVVTSQGTVTPRTESVLVSQVSGLVQEVSSDFVVGGFFEKGDRLVTLDRRDYEYALVQAQSQFARAELALKIEKEQGRIAIEEWQRLNDEAAPPLVARQPQLLEAQANLESAKASVEQASLNLDRATIRAPFDGRVRTKNVDVGQYVTTVMTLATIYAIEYAEVRLPLPDHELAFLDMPFDYRNPRSGHKGPAVTLKARFAGRDQHWFGYISRIEAEVDARSRMIHAVVRVEDPYSSGSNGTQTPLAVGLFVEAAIEGK
ncbi:efflux RND transporter periplasmic adaptor subunit, partial [bacterium]|nr:efflux RND transporter periplasmic adaptor subunit [bacterium]